MLTIKDNSLNAKDTFYLNKILGLGYEVLDNVAYIKIKRNELANALGVNSKTITRKLQQFGEVGYVKVDKKRGRNGGYVLQLNPDKFNFPADDSNLKKPTKNIVNMVEKLYKRKDRVQGVRRTQEEMALYRKEQERMSEEQRQANKLLMTDYRFKAVDWNFFSQTSEPERNFRIWVISRAYDTYVKMYEDKYVQSYKAKEHVGQFYYGIPRRRHSKTYHSLTGEFIGNRNFKSFSKLLDYAEEINENPIVLMGKVFERYAFNHYSYEHKPKVPVPNQVVDKNGIRVIETSLKNQKETNRNRMRASTDFMGNVELISINREYLEFGNKSIKDYIQVLGDTSETRSFRNFYNQLMFNVKDKLTLPEQHTLRYFMNEQARMLVGRTGVTHVSSELGSVYFDMLKKNFKQSVDTNTVNEFFSQLADLMGNYETGSAGMGAFSMASAYKANEDWNNNARKVRTIILQRYNMYSRVSEVMAVIEKIATYLPLTKLGMLKRDIVLKNY